MQAAALLRAKKILRWLDPNDDPSAEPLSPIGLLAVLVATGFSTYLFLRWKIQPMQDNGLHLALTSVFANYGKAGSIYPPIYKPLDWLNTNSLLYTVAGGLGKVIGPSLAFRLTLATYFAGVPLANVYALRVFGRSVWGAVISVPLLYNLSCGFGFANFLFSAPLAVMALPLFYRMHQRPTVGRVAICAALVTALFLAHLHTFLWMGVLLFMMTIAALVSSSVRVLFGFPATRPHVVLGVSLVAVLPGVALLGRWLYRTLQPPAADELVIVGVEKSSLGTWMNSIIAPDGAFARAHQVMTITKSTAELWYRVAILALVLVAIVLARLHKWKRPPILELACVVTLLSFFVLPDNFAGQQIIASRQIGFAGWFASALFVPVPGRVTRLGRAFVVGAMCCVSAGYLMFYRELLIKFEKEEANGLAEVIAAAPPQKRLHYVNLQPESKYFTFRPFWHVETWYMADRLGQCDENPAWGNSQAVRYRKTYNLMRIEQHSPRWPAMMEIWKNFDLVLVRQWHPTEADLQRANEYGERIAQRGDWEIWRSKIAR